MSQKLTFSNSYIESINGIDYLFLREKNHYETGVAAGNLFLKSDYKIIRLLKNFFVKIILSLFYLANKKKIQEVRVPEEYRDELRGCAKATGIPYKHLLLINLIYEVKGCSGFAFFNPDSSLLLGHNFDMSQLLAKFALRYVKPLITNVAVPGKNKFTHIPPLPLVMLGAMNGFNEKGIAVSTHDAGGVYAKVVRNNMSTSCFIRTILERANNMGDVQKIAAENFVYYPFIMIIASAQGCKASVFEAYPSDFDFVNIFGHSHAFSANHYQSNKMRMYHKIVKKGSLDRLVCLNENLSGKNTLSVQEAAEILKDHRNGIQRDTTGHSIANIGTFQSFVFDVTKGDIYISNGKKLPVPLTGDFVRINTNA